MTATDCEEFLCCPFCKGSLVFAGTDPASGSPARVSCEKCDKVYLSSEGYIDFLGEKHLTHTSKREKIVRSFYAKYYTPLTDFMFLFCGGPKNARREVIRHLKITGDDVVLETGMGPGDNFPWLTSGAANLRIFGIDIQKQMLVHSLRNTAKWNIKADLFRADAEELPFRDEKFNVVFHLGAFNLFDNKKRALDEMIRVAKPGTRIVIADESEKGGKIFNWLNGTEGVVVPPLDLVPAGMTNINMETIWRGFGYVIAFTKP